MWCSTAGAEVAEVVSAQDAEVLVHSTEVQRSWCSAGAQGVEVQR
jgi:hypothetical protein